MNKLKQIFLIVVCILSLAAITAPLPARALTAGNVNADLCDTDDASRAAKTPPLPPLTAQQKEDVKNNPACQPPATENPISGPSGIIIKGAQFLSIIIGFAGVIMIMVAGVKFITAAGEPAKVSSARNTIMYAAIGLAIAGIAQGIVAFMLNVLK